MTSKNKESLDPNGKVSNMRQNHTKITNLVIGSIVFVLLISAVQVIKGSIIDWTGIASVIGALGVLQGASAGAKAYQKRSE